MITQKELKEWVSYNPRTGIFTAAKDSYRKIRKIGDVCGSYNKQRGYNEICINRNRYLAHRLAFLYITGEMPKNEVDHINHNVKDNSWNNLRDVEHTDNQRNRPIFSNNKSGFVGVSKVKSSGKWYAYIQVNRRSINLGYHDTIDEAVKARKLAEIKYKFHANHGK